MICRRCAGIGHGISCCHQMVTCIYCAQNHFGVNCPNSEIDNETGRTARSPKCANCDFAGLRSDHIATDLECPLALAEKEKLKTGFGKAKNASNQSKKVLTISHENDPSWPALRKALFSAKSDSAVDKANNKTTYESYANVTMSSSTPTPQSTPLMRSRSRSRHNHNINRDRSQSGVSFANSVGNSSFAADDNSHFAQLLSMEQMVTIATEIANGYQCATLTDQIQLILRAIKKVK